MGDTGPHNMPGSNPIVRDRLTIKGNKGITGDQWTLNGESCPLIKELLCPLLKKSGKVYYRTGSFVDLLLK